MSDSATIRQNSSRLLVALLACALMVFFAIATKASVYGPHQRDLQDLTATKVLQNDAARVVPSAPVLQEILAATIAFLLLAKGFTSEECASVAEPRVTRFEWFSPALSVRPPPSL